MKNNNKNKKRRKVLSCEIRANKKRRFNSLNPICWVIIPVITVALLVLDAIGVYTFNVERLIVLGIGLLVVLLPFFSEITIKNFSIKRNKGDSNLVS